MTVIVNFKGYAFGKKAFRIAKSFEGLKGVMVAVQPSDIHKLKHAKVPVLAQHVDICEGKCTGSILADAVLGEGAIGSLINHSERRLGFSEIQERVVYLKKRKALSVVCAQSVAEAVKLAKLKPSFIAFEPPELIATKCSVSEKKPDSIAKCAKLGVPLLVGAGIHTKHDVVIAKKLGAKGVLVASSVMLSKNPRKELVKLVK